MIEAITNPDFYVYVLAGFFIAEMIIWSQK
jgi:hypothetical protein